MVVKFGMLVSVGGESGTGVLWRVRLLLDLGKRGVNCWRVIDSSLGVKGWLKPLAFFAYNESILYPLSCNY